MPTTLQSPVALKRIFFNSHHLKFFFIRNDNAVNLKPHKTTLFTEAWQASADDTIELSPLDILKT